jgi:hypothetical protein
LTETHSFASLLRSRFAFIVAIVLKRTVSKPMAIFQFQTFLSSFNYFWMMTEPVNLSNKEAEKDIKLALHEEWFD